MDFATWLNSQLEQVGVSGSILAQKSGLSSSYISTLRTGKRTTPSLAVRENLRNAFVELGGQEVSEAPSFSEERQKYQETFSSEDILMAGEVVRVIGFSVTSQEMQQIIFLCQKIRLRQIR